MTVVVDAHQHFWSYGTYQTSWMERPPYAGDPTLAPIRRSFGPEDLAPELAAVGVRATIAVEAADGEMENVAICAVGRSHEWIAGVVGWVPLDRPEKTARLLDQLCEDPKFVGVRHLVNVEPDPDWILRPQVIEGLAVVAERGLTFDYVGILPRHLEHVPQLADAFPAYGSCSTTLASHRLPTATSSRGARCWCGPHTRRTSSPSCLGSMPAGRLAGPP